MAENTPPAVDIVDLSLEEVRALALSVLRKAGLTETQAAPVAETITLCERDGRASHGLLRLPGCVMTIESANFNLQAEPEVSEPSAAVVRVDAGFGYSLPAFERGLPLLEEKAKALGVAVLAINNCFHFSALWPEVETLARRGLAALAMTPSHAWVAPFGGIKPVLGTNPLAFGWPRADKNPYVFDFATSAMARSDIAMAGTKGETLPEGCGLNEQGNPSTVPAEVLAGAMTTFGGHKGTALSTMIELLAGPLIGDMTSRDSMEFDAGEKAAPCHGELIVAFDPALLGGDDPALNEARAEALFAAFTDQGARLPSQQRYGTRARTQNTGVSIPRALYDRITELGGERATQA
ncbi:Ldh family oxidoreductase [Thalassorhabdomicrobium marinisediminis]|uniref:Oxidoreductase n=1 Tax=Thalassorhabdomicrobium marinisediminis TaxID=2170577 RepID=A0A2T7FYY8_9RHOB|nr:Ldh family oxidoreductase [Thalassorhabdomicrobium marinisediminis]PVA07384.1 oxidoreductase [Thalassorhabdomicrobium marinisediminis]